MRVLIVEDEKDLANALTRGLKIQGYSVDVAFDGEQALNIIEINNYDIIILDINLPKLNGMEVCRRLRADGSSAGILMLTARSAIDDRIQGLDIGADDYLVKPFHFSELLARIRAVLRREGEPRKVILRSGELTLDPNNSKVYVRTSEINLTVKEFSILEYMLRNAGRVVSPEELIEHVWNEEANLFTQVVKVHINNIRNKLKVCGGGTLIQTVKNKGYVVS
jgi:two-component system OmpR family response regulator